MGLLVQSQGDKLNLTYDVGSDETLRLTIRDFNGALLDVHAWTFRATAKASADDPMSAALFQLSTPSNLGIDAASNGASGIVDIKFGAALCGFPFGDSIWDVQGTDPGGLIHSIVPASKLRGRKVITAAGVVPAPGVITALPFGMALTPPFFVFSPNGDQLWHKFDIINDGFGNYLLTDVGQNATYPF